MSEELKPCPFCGADAFVYNDSVERKADYPDNFFTVQCRNCLASVEVYGKAEAIAAWNARPAPAVQVPEGYVSVAQVRGWLERAKVPTKQYLYCLKPEEIEWMLAAAPAPATVATEAVAQGGGVDDSALESAANLLQECIVQNGGNPSEMAIDWVRKISALLSASPAGAGGDAPYIVGTSSTREYNPKYGDDRMCECGHPYYRHFDSYEEMAPVGCKYCDCYEFKERAAAPAIAKQSEGE